MVFQNNTPIPHNKVFVFSRKGRKTHAPWASNKKNQGVIRKTKNSYPAIPWKTGKFVFPLIRLKKKNPKIGPPIILAQKNLITKILGNQSNAKKEKRKPGVPPVKMNAPNPISKNPNPMENEKFPALGALFPRFLFLKRH